MARAWRWATSPPWSSTPPGLHGGPLAVEPPPEARCCRCVRVCVCVCGWGGGAYLPWCNGAGIKTGHVAPLQVLGSGRCWPPGVVLCTTAPQLHTPVRAVTAAGGARGGAAAARAGARIHALAAHGLHHMLAGRHVAVAAAACTPPRHTHRHPHAQAGGLDRPGVSESVSGSTHPSICLPPGALRPQGV